MFDVRSFATKSHEAYKSLAVVVVSAKLSVLAKDRSSVMR